MNRPSARSGAFRGGFDNTLGRIGDTTAAEELMRLTKDKSLLLRQRAPRSGNSRTGFPAARERLRPADGGILRASLDMDVAPQLTLAAGAVYAPISRIRWRRVAALRRAVSWNSGRCISTRRRGGGSCG